MAALAVPGENRKYVAVISWCVSVHRYSGNPRGSAPREKREDSDCAEKNNSELKMESPHRSRGISYSYFSSGCKAESGISLLFRELKARDGAVDHIFLNLNKIRSRI